MKVKQLFAITRQVSSSINRCELTHIAREPINYDRARLQHQQYEEALRSLGVQVISLPEEQDLPDSVFVEDTALVLDECAIMLNPGAASRRPEVDSVEKALSPYRETYRMPSGGSLDGGDILRIGKHIFVGLSDRSTEEGVSQLSTILEQGRMNGPSGYQIHQVKVSGCLHLKSAVTQVRENTLLINPDWVSKDDFPGMQFIDIHPSEVYAANALLVGKKTICSSSFPKTQEKLHNSGVEMLTLATDELAKAEGALTCCSLIFKQ